MKNALLTVFCGIALFVAAQNEARAVAVVGDPVQIAFKAVDGTPINTQALQGKLVVVDFWATWCGPCMQMVPHMVELNQKYGSKGLQIIGISLDEDRQAMINTTRQRRNGLAGIL